MDTFLLQQGDREDFFGAYELGMEERKDQMGVLMLSHQVDNHLAIVVLNCVCMCFLKIRYF